MESGLIYLFSEQEVSPLLGVSFIKEVFIHGDFKNITWINLALRTDITQRYDLPFSTLKKNMIEKMTFSDFKMKYGDNYIQVKKFFENNKQHISWLELLQLSILTNENHKIEEYSQKLFQYYQKVISVN